MEHFAGAMNCPSILRPVHGFFGSLRQASRPLLATDPRAVVDGPAYNLPHLGIR